MNTLREQVEKEILPWSGSEQIDEKRLATSILQRFRDRIKKKMASFNGDDEGYAALVELEQECE